jgi:hypothetical protein
MKNNAVIIQQSNSDGDLVRNCLRIAFPRNSAYAGAHNMDYRVNLGDVAHDQLRGAWHKIYMLRDALLEGYEYAFWIDCDAAIWDFDVDLRDAFIGKTGSIGACIHDANGIPRHLNVGVLFVKNTPEALAFLNDWINEYPGDLQWMEQGSFNKLSKEREGVTFQMDDRFNATINVNMVDKPVIYGWHGVNTWVDRAAMIRAALVDDHLKFRV